MMGVDQRPTVIDKTILPVERYGVKIISMGFFVQENAPCYMARADARQNVAQFLY